MELNWDLCWKNDSNHPVVLPDRGVLEELYPEGLSSHGVQYLTATVVANNDVSFPDGFSNEYRAAIAVVDLEGEGKNVFLNPFSVQYERVFELIRLSEFPRSHSRFQAFFAWDSIDQAHQSPDVNGSDYNIAKVSCPNHSKRDMSLLKFGNFGDSVRKARKYWTGVSGDSPVYEIVMEPPVEVLEIIEC